MRTRGSRSLAALCLAFGGEAQLAGFGNFGGGFGGGGGGGLGGGLGGGFGGGAGGLGGGLGGGFGGGFGGGLGGGPGGLGGGLAQQGQQQQQQPSGQGILNDLRNLQFPPMQGQQQGSPPPLGGMLAGFGGAARPQQGTGFGGMPQQPGAFGAVPQQQQQQQPPGYQRVEVEDPDFGCRQGAGAPAWQAAKKQLRALFEAAGTPLTPMPKETLSQARDAITRELQAVGALADSTMGCGLGRLSLQILSLASIDEPQALAEFFSQTEPLASPVLTLLLDLPWLEVAQAGWPVLALLGQVNFRKQAIPDVNTAATDGLDQELGAAFYAALTNALVQGDEAGMQQASVAFLQMEADVSAMAPLTAMAAQAAVAMEPNKRAQILEALQAMFQRVLSTPEALDVALFTQWPLWGLLHIGVDAFAPDA